MSKCYLRYTGINIMHEHVVHVQHVHHQSTCISVTPVQSLFLDYFYFFCALVTLVHVLYLR